MSDVVVIPCAGEQTRWENYLGVDKYMAPGLDREPILHRSLRLLGTSLPNAAFAIIGRPDAPAAPTLVPGLRDRYAFWFSRDAHPIAGPTVEKLTSSRSSWSVSGRTIIVWGDVWLSKWAAKRIAGLDGDMIWFGRPGPSRYTGKPYRELWGCSFRRCMHDTLEEACREVGAAHARGEAPLLAWAVYQHLEGHGYSGTHTHFPNLVVLDDFTEDFDYPSDYDRWAFRAQRALIEGTFDLGVPPE